MSGPTEALNWFQAEVGKRIPIHSFKWKFVTSGSDGIGLYLVVASTGDIKLKDPQGQQHRFNYTGAGLGLSTSSLRAMGKVVAKVPAFLRWAGILKKNRRKELWWKGICN